MKGERDDVPAKKEKIFPREKGKKLMHGRTLQSREKKCEGKKPVFLIPPGKRETLVGRRETYL